MSEINETTKLDPATLDDHATLTETELGLKVSSTPGPSPVLSRFTLPSRNRTQPMEHPL